MKILILKIVLLNVWHTVGTLWVKFTCLNALMQRFALAILVKWKQFKNLKLTLSSGKKITIKAKATKGFVTKIVK